MRYYTQSHQYYCGVDLHTRTMYLCILDAQGQRLFHQNLPTEPEAFLKAIAPYRNDLVIGCDGNFSAVRKVLWPEATPKFTGQGVWRYNFARDPSVDCLQTYNGATGVGLVPMSEAVRMSSPRSQSWPPCRSRTRSGCWTTAATVTLGFQRSCMSQLSFGGHSLWIFVRTRVRCTQVK